MNEKFFSLPKEKQQKIINAGFRVFSQNTYKKSPVSEIAAEAGISKALLFHYFKNKKELYLFLLKKCADITVDSLEQDGCYEPEDMFDAMYLGLKSKISIMKEFPDLGSFVIKAYYESDPEVSSEVSLLLSRKNITEIKSSAKWFNPDHYIPGLNLKMMYRDMYLASEGLIWEKQQSARLDPDELDREFRELIDFWKSIYLRKPT